MRAQELITEHLDRWTSATTHAANGRRKNSKVELTGIQSLRELILELAVHGRLVEQDSADTPAPQLLTKISEHREQLIESGGIKNSKPLPPVLDDEAPSALPAGWTWTRLGTIAEIGPRNSAEDTTEASFVPMPLVTTSHRGEHGEEPRTWADIKKGYSHFADGDIALAKITPCFENSKAAVFKNLRNGIGAGTTELHVARPLSKAINPYFILLFLKSPKYLTQGEQVMTGSAGQKRVPKDYFSGTPLPLPPEQEQSRIVHKVDELMALCDRLAQQTSDQLEAHETLVDTLLNTLTQSENATELADNWARLAAHFDTLFATEQSIDKLKQTILQLAVMGKLVEQDSNDGCSKHLLQMVKNEQEELIKSKKMKRPKVEFKVADVNIPHSIPSSWSWTPIADISFKITDGEHSTPRRSPDGRYLLSARNVTNGGIKLNDVDFVPQEEFERIRQRCDPNVGDILISCSGSVGRVALVDKDDEYAMVRSAAMIRPAASQIDINYLRYALQSPCLQSQIIEGSRQSAQSNLFLGAISKLLVPIPPLPEQCRIAQTIDELMALCDQLKQHLSQASQTRCHLAEVVVERALN